MNDETEIKKQSQMGRPLIEINWKEFDKLCTLQCTKREIASWFDCSEDTIERAIKRVHNTTFAVYFEQKRGVGQIALRRKQYEAAMGGNVPLLIFLGKNYLGQSNEQEVIHSVADAPKRLIVDMGEDDNTIEVEKND